MPESFLHLEREEQSQIYRALAPQLARSPVVLEKDVWVCWVLQTLFTMADRLPMAFKGGTSLSKVFGAIARFSEDVDITLDYRGLDGTFDPFAEGVSRNRLKKFSEDLKSFVRDHAHGVVAPHFQKMLATEFSADAFRLEISDDGEQLRVHYPTVLEKSGDSLLQSPITGEKIPLKQYDYQSLAALRNFDLSGEPVAFVKVVELGYAAGNGRSLLVKIWTKDVDDIYAAARSLIGPAFDFRDHHLNYAKLSIKLKKVGKDRARSITVILRDDNKCNIKTKREKDRALCDRLLAKWHLVKEIGHVVEAPADTVAA